MTMYFYIYIFDQSANHFTFFSVVLCDFNKIYSPCKCTQLVWRICNNVANCNTHTVFILFFFFVVAFTSTAHYFHTLDTTYTNIYIYAPSWGAVLWMSLSRSRISHALHTTIDWFDIRIYLHIWVSLVFSF